MKKILAHFFLFNIIFLFLFSVSHLPASAATVRLELEPSSVPYGGEIKATAFGCPSGKVDFFWQTAENKAAGSKSYYKQGGVNTSPSSENPATIVAVFNHNTTIDTPGDWYMHVYCTVTKENSPDVKFTVQKESKSNEVVGLDKLDKVEGYKQFQFDYQNFLQGQCYYIEVVPLSGSLYDDIRSLHGVEGGNNLPNYNKCTTTNALNTVFYSSNTLSPSGTFTIIPLPPGVYKIQVSRSAAQPDPIIATKEITVNDSTNTPKVQINPNVIKTNTAAQISIQGCPPNSQGLLKWSKKDNQWNDQDASKAVSFDANGKLKSSLLDDNALPYVTQSFVDENNNQLWVECGAVKSPYEFFTVTNKNPADLPQIFMQLPDKSIKKQGDTIAFPSGSSVTIWATQCPHTSGSSNKANFKWKHAKQSGGIMEQWGNRDNVGINMSTGETEHFAVPFVDDNYNQIQAFCSSDASAPLFFTVGDPQGLTKDKDNNASPTPTPTAKPIYPPCVEGKNAAGTTIYVMEGKPDYDTIQSRLKDIVKCTKVGSAIGDISTDPQGFILKLFQIFLSISGGIALLIIIRSGYKYMTSQGNAETVKTAQEEITSAIVGLLFLVFSMVILQVIGVDILQLPGLTP